MRLTRPGSTSLSVLQREALQSTQPKNGLCRMQIASSTPLLRLVRYVATECVGEEASSSSFIRQCDVSHRYGKPRQVITVV